MNLLILLLSGLDFELLVKCGAQGHIHLISNLLILIIGCYDWRTLICLFLCITNNIDFSSITRGRGNVQCVVVYCDRFVWCHPWLSAGVQTDMWCGSLPTVQMYNRYIHSSSFTLYSLYHQHHVLVYVSLTPVHATTWRVVPLPWHLPLVLNIRYVRLIDYVVGWKGNVRTNDVDVCILITLLRS